MWDTGTLGKRDIKVTHRMFLVRMDGQGSVQLCAALLLSAARAKGTEGTSASQD